MPAGELVQAVSTAKHKFDGADLRVGVPFECTESELAELRVLDFAQLAPRKPAPAPVKVAALLQPSSPSSIEAEAVGAEVPAPTVDVSPLASESSTPTPSPSVDAQPKADAPAETRRTTRRTRVPE